MNTTIELIETTTFWVGLGKIVWVNLLLSGDNAVVIALAARGLPERQQNRAVFLGSAAAILIRVLLTLFAVQLLQLPYLKMIGAVLLLWIGVNLLRDNEDSENHIKEGSTVLAAIRTILLADLVMSLDNVMGVAGAAQGAASPEIRDILIIFGLGLSIPIVIWGSGIVLKIMERLPIVVVLGAMLLGWIAGEMFARETLIENLLGATAYAEYGLAAAGAIIVLIGGFLSRQPAGQVNANDS
jgi:YjbE family integral membrane protein